MDTKYPKEMKLYATKPGVKKTFVSDVQVLNPYDCPNCGGAGVMSLFAATDGPYQSPASPYRTVTGFNDEGQQVERSLTNHFANDAWWVGQLYTFPCPVCEGIGHTRMSQGSRNADPQIKRMAKGMEK